MSASGWDRESPRFPRPQSVQGCLTRRRRRHSHDPAPAASEGLPVRRSSRTRILSLAGVGLAGIAMARAAFAVVDNGAAPGDTVPVPAVAEGAEALGSDLDTVDRTVDCLGGEPRAGSKPCSIVQSKLPGARLLVPADGMIVGWAVSGARGEVSLDVIRPRGEDTVRVALSQWEAVGNTAPHRFKTALSVERGDLLGIHLAPGAAVGVAETNGAETQRWIAPADGFYGNPTRAPGTGFDYELAVRADFVAGAVLESPERVTGREALRAPDGLVRRLKEVEISKPEGTVDVALTEVGDRVALDLFVSGDRQERLFVPGLEAGGMPIAMESALVEGEEFGGRGRLLGQPQQRAQDLLRVYRLEKPDPVPGLTGSRWSSQDRSSAASGSSGGCRGARSGSCAKRLSSRSAEASRFASWMTKRALASDPLSA